ncbi:MAG: hypothetical protein LBJ36_05090 [Synergistaceae bacterium]|nr:hypothetical protein [Synergistaceae bacterium]
MAESPPVLMFFLSCRCPSVGPWMDVFEMRGGTRPGYQSGCQCGCKYSQSGGIHL